jgi:hypothetical protein
MVLYQGESVIINVQNGKDVITLDFVLGQIRYCHNIAKHGEIEFLDQSQTTMDCFKYLYENNKKTFLEAVAEDVGNDVRKQIDPTKLQVITDREYLEVFK